MNKLMKAGCLLAVALGVGHAAAQEPLEPAPTPTEDASKVYSHFSDAYEAQGKFDVTFGDWTGATAKTIVTPFADAPEEHVLRIEGLTTGSVQNNAQVSLGGKNWSSYGYLHLDVYSPTENGIGEFGFYLLSGWSNSKTVDAGVWTEFTATGENRHDKWISFDVPLSQFSSQGLDLTNVTIIRLVRGKKGAAGTVLYVDNVYVYGESTGSGGGDQPENPDELQSSFTPAGNVDLNTDVPLVAAPTPTHEASIVKSCFSNFYTGTYKFDPAQSDYGDPKTTKTLIQINGTDDVLKIENLVNGAKANVSLGSPNLSDVNMIHMDIFSPGNDQGIGEFDFSLTDWSGNGSDAGIWLNITEKGWHGQWISVDVPIEKWSAANLIRFRRGGKGSAGSLLYVDNVYFYKATTSGGGEDPDPGTPQEPSDVPTTVPTIDITADRVKSIFCEQFETEGYQEEQGIVSAGNWGQNANQKEEFVEIVEGNSTLKLTSWDVFPFKVHKTSEVMDISDMDYLHCSVFLAGELDETGKAASITFWFNDKSNNAVSNNLPYMDLKKGEWVSVSIPLDNFSGQGFDLSQLYVIRLKVGGYKTQDIYVDNIFAYKGEAIPGSVGSNYSGSGDDKEPIQDSTAGELPPMDQPYLGVNLASASGGTVPGTFGFDYVYPKNEDLYYFKAKGMRLLRIPFRAPRLQHELGGELDYNEEKSDIKALASVVAEAERLGMWVLLDMHDYCERSIDGVLYEYGVAGKRVWDSNKNAWGEWEATDAPYVTTAHFADLWKKIATEFKDYKNIWGYDLMNEPKGIDINVLFDNYQAAINAIREVDTKAQIVVEGKNYANSPSWESLSDKLKDLVDPANMDIVYEAHCYFDKDNSGTYQNSYDQEIGTNTEIYKQRIDPFIAWLKKNNKKGMLGEYGVPYNGHAKGDERYMDLIDDVFAYLKENQLTSTYWCGGAMYDAYALSVQPDKDYYTEKSTMKIMEPYIKNFANEASVTGVAAAEKTAVVKVYPNPVGDVLNVSTGAPMQRIDVFNLMGQMVCSASVDGSEAVLNVASLESGCYMLRIENADGNVASCRFVKR